MRLRAEILLRIGNPYVLVTAAQAKKIAPGWKRPVPVVIQVNGQPNPPWHINMMPVGDGSFYLYLHGDVRKASKTQVGDVVDVDVVFDGAYHNGPMHPMPPEFKAALKDNPVAKANWGKLIPSRQKEILRYFSFLKSQEALDRNVAKAVAMLGGEAGRFMARSWKNGS